MLLTCTCTCVPLSHTGVFEHHPAECDPGDEEAEMDDDPVICTGERTTCTLYIHVYTCGVSYQSLDTIIFGHLCKNEATNPIVITPACSQK